MVIAEAHRVVADPGGCESEFLVGVASCTCPALLESP